MLKTVTINLAGQVFHIDENAYEVLFAYLQKIKSFYKNEEGADEILADIEARFAEIFLSKLSKTGKNVVSLPDVEEVIAIMGNPEEFEGYENMASEQKEEPKHQNSSSANSSKDAEKRLYRNPDDKIVAGVCSGLANYLGVNDPVWIRVLFILAVIFGLSGALIYLVLMLIVPEASTSAQKLQMKGEPVNLSNIEKTLRDGVKTVGDNFEQISKKDGVLYQLVEFIGKAFGIFFKVFFAIFKFLFYFIGAAIVLGLIIGLGALAITGIAGIPVATDYIADTPSEAIIGGIGTLLLFGIPALALILVPFQLFSKNIRPFSKPITFSFLSIWLIGLVLTIVSVINISRNFSVNERFSKETLVPITSKMDTIFISSKGNGHVINDLNIQIGWNNYDNDKDDFYFGKVEINVEESPDSNFYIVEEYSASGKDKSSALRNVRNISHDYILKGNHIIIDNIALTKDNSKKWRNQKVKFTLQIPSNTIVVFNDVEEYIRHHPKIKSDWYENTSLESSAWRLKDSYLYPLDSNIIWSKDDETDYSKINIKKDFDEVEVNGNIDIEIIGSHETELLAINTKDINVKFENGILFISSKNEITLRDLAHPVKVKLYINEINQLNINGATRAKFRNFVNGPLDIRASGASEVIFENMGLDDLDLKLSGQSTLKGRAEVGSAKISASGSSKIEGVNIDIDELDIELSGASTAYVSVNDRIEGHLSGASELEYRKKESITIEEFSTSGTSRVIPKN